MSSDTVVHDGQGGQEGAQRRGQPGADDRPHQRGNCGDKEQGPADGLLAEHLGDAGRLGPGAAAEERLARLWFVSWADMYLRSIGAGSVEQVPTPDASPRPLGSARWAGAVDSVGGETLAWQVRTMQRGGSIAAFGNAGGPELPTSVLPFILRAVNLLGINTGYFEDALRQRLRARMATDLRPGHLDRMTSTIGFDELQQAFNALLNGTVRGRLVVDLG